MARITHTDNVVTSPRWAAEFLAPDKLIPGGAKVVADDFPDGTDGTPTIPGGTVVGRTFAERTAGTGFSPAADTDDEIFIVAFDVIDADLMDDVELVKPGTTIYEDLLPDWATLGTVQPLVRAAYVCIVS